MNLKFILQAKKIHIKIMKYLKNMIKKFLLRPYFYLGFLLLIILLNLFLPYNRFCYSAFGVFILFIKCYFRLKYHYIINYKNITELDLRRDIYSIIISLFITLYICTWIIILFGEIFPEFCIFTVVYAMAPEPEPLDTNGANNVISNNPAANTNSSGNVVSNNASSTNGIASVASNNTAVNTNGSSSVASNNTAANTNSLWYVNSSSIPTVYRPNAAAGTPGFSHWDILQTPDLRYTAVEQVIDDFSWCLKSRLIDCGVHPGQPRHIMDFHHKWVIEKYPSIFPDGVNTLITEERLNLLYQVRHTHFDDAAFATMNREQANWIAGGVSPTAARYEALHRLPENSTILSQIYHYRRSNDMLNRMDTNSSYR